jgi:hypothetical protein
VAEHVRVGLEPDHAGEPGEAAANVVGVERGATLGPQHQIQFDRAGWLAGLDPPQGDGGGLVGGQPQAGLLAAPVAAASTVQGPSHSLGSAEGDLEPARDRAHSVTVRGVRGVKRGDSDVHRDVVIDRPAPFAGPCGTLAGSWPTTEAGAGARH